MLCQLSYSHRRNFIIATGGERKGVRRCEEIAAMVVLSIEGCASFPGLDGRGARRHMSWARTAEGGRRRMLLLDATDADVLESEGAEASGVEQIFRVDDDWLLQQVLDAIEVESAELGPARPDD